MGIHERLREERERLGLTQEAFGHAGGVRKQAQHLYESGARKPDTDYLQAIASTGADVLYILTGQRSAPLPPQEQLPMRQRRLLDNYEALSEESKRHAEATVSLLAKQAPRKTA